jgi:hypothetical protein
MPAVQQWCTFRPVELALLADVDREWLHAIEHPTSGITSHAQAGVQAQRKHTFAGGRASQ